MKKMFLVAEKDEIKQLEKSDSVYRAIIIKGSTYTESEFRKWAVNVFKAQPNSSLSELAKACAKGGWRVIQMVIY